MEKKCVDLYRKFAQYYNVAQGFISSLNHEVIRVQVIATQRDLERSEKVKFEKEYGVVRKHGEAPEIIHSQMPKPIENMVWQRLSIDGSRKAVIRKWKNKENQDQQFIEVWNSNGKIVNVNLTERKEHGKVNDSDGEFGSFEWSPCSRYLLFIAEEKRPESMSFFKKVTDESKTDVKRGHEHDYIEDWGEQLVDKSKPVVCIFDTEQSEVKIVKTEQDISCGQAIWISSDQLAFIGWPNEPYRVGLVYCHNRSNALYCFTRSTGAIDVLYSQNTSVKSPRLTLDGKNILLLETAVFGPHQQCARLIKVNIESKQVATIVDTVENTRSACTFPGIYCLSMPRRCFSHDGATLFFSTIWGTHQVPVSVDLASGEVRRLAHDGCWDVLDVHNHLLLASHSSPNEPESVVVCDLGKTHGAEWVSLESPDVCLESIQWDVIRLTPEDPLPAAPTDDQSESVRDVLSRFKYAVKAPGVHSADLDHVDIELLVLRPTGLTAPYPLIIFPHGGPHATFVATFGLYLPLLCEAGFGIVQVNYRGSLGFGKKGVESLPGNIGRMDVDDVMTALAYCIDEKIGDPDRLACFGGSHGGFLVAHMIGQFPNVFKACIARNPVINVASMVGSTDIPDWCVTEAGRDFSFGECPKPDLYEQMWRVSPIQYIDRIKTPTLIMLGDGDRRVPPKQGMELYRALRSRSAPCRLVVYKGNCHPLTEVDAEADAFVNICMWITENMK